MKILWVCNMPIEPIAKDMKLGVSISGGWIMGMYNEIVKNPEYELGICFPLKNKRKSVWGSCEGVKYYSFYQKSKLSGLPDTLSKSNLTRKHLENIIKDFSPDVLYVFGTEYSHSLIATEVFSKPERTVINIQGLVSEIAKCYYADLPESAIRKFTFSNLFRGSITKQKREMELRGKNEISVIRKANYAVGRTDWDKACVEKINPAIKYYSCNESLRSVFYENAARWSFDKCEKHTVFVTQAGYTIKGLHYLLKAMPQILDKYPDTKVFVAGRNPVKPKTVKGRLLISSYGLYLDKLIKENRLENSIVFLGSLPQEKMVDRFLKANVFVLPSAIENSPNSLGEAMLLGVPSVAADVGGVGSMAENDKEAVLYTHNDSLMLADAIIGIFSDNERANSLSERAHLRAEKNHDRKTNCENVLRLYDEIAKR